MKALKLVLVVVIVAFTSCNQNENEIFNIEKIKISEVEKNNFIEIVNDLEKNNIVNSKYNLSFENSFKETTKKINENNFFIFPSENYSFLSYDSQDNVVEFKNKYLHNNNPYFKFYLIPNSNIILIKSEIYEIEKIKTLDFYGASFIYYSNNKKRVYIYYPKITYHYLHKEVFEFDVMFSYFREKKSKDLLEI